MVHGPGIGFKVPGIRGRDRGVGLESETPNLKPQTWNFICPCNTPRQP